MFIEITFQCERAFPQQANITTKILIKVLINLKNLIIIINLFKTISRADWDLGPIVDTYLVMCAINSLTGGKKEQIG